MIRNYLKIAIRQLLKHKLFSLLNIFGLATSMAVCLLLIMIIMDQYSYDDFHENGDRIYRVISKKSDKSEPLFEPNHATTSLTLGEDLPAAYPFIEKCARIIGLNGYFQIDEKNLETDEGGYAVDADFLEMFSFGWQNGQKETALKEPYSVVLTENFAKKISPEENPIGKMVKFEELGEFTITGIIPETPVRSHLRFDFLISYSTIENFTKEQKDLVQVYGFDHIWRGLVYVLLKDGTTESAFENALSEQALAYSEKDKNHHYLFQPQALVDVVPSRDLANEPGVGTPSIVLQFLMVLGLIIMLAACFNYINLSVARSLKRAKEIGIRKVAGARKQDIIFQFLGEAILIALLSLGVAMCLLEFLIPAFYGLDPFVETIFHLTKTPELYFVFFLFSLIIGLFAGLFPAFNISRFQPIQAIQQLSNIKLFSKLGFRKALVTVQFVLSLIFILTVIIVLQQEQKVLNADLGVNIENMMNVSMQEEVDFDVFAQQVSQIKGIEEVSASRDALLMGHNRGALVKINDQSDSMMMYHNWVSENYLENMEIELIAGENFPKNVNSLGEQFIIINEKAVDRMGYKTPNEALGKSIIWDTLGLTVIGVVKDFHHENIWFGEINPYGLRHGGEYKANANIRISATNSSETIKSIHQTWANLSPEKSISAYFTDERAYFLKKFFRMGSSIIGFVGFLTILISCLGLLGMVIYTIEGKLKEVGIRKVLGASELNINWQLAKTFLWMIGIAILVAVPLIIFVGNLWLNNFVIRTSISPWIIFGGVGIMFFLSALTVLSQTFLAARANPVEVLRSE